MKSNNLYLYGSIWGSFLFCGCAKEELPPNIIFLLTDDQRFDALGCMGNPYISTPNMDKLGSEGVIFKNAYATTPISCVSRASIFTGQYASKHGIQDFTTPLTIEQWRNTYPSILKDNGYYIGFIGKYGVGHSDIPSDKFDYWHSFSNQGWYYKRDSLELKNIDKIVLSQTDSEHLTVTQGKQIHEFLNIRDKNKPFCLSVSFKAPHCQDEMRRPGGEEFPIDKVDSLLYKDVCFPISETASDSFYYALPERFRYSQLKNKENEARIRWKWRFSTDSLYQETVRKYYTLIHGVDREIGIMMKELERQGIADNTVIVVMGDNGFYLGEHGLAGKWFAHDQSIRIPLLIYDPRLQKDLRGRVSYENVLNIDICPTLLSLAGIDVPTEVQGCSLLPILNGGVKNWRDYFYIEYQYNPKGAHLPAMEGIVNKEYKLVRYYADGEEWWELYDRKKDKMELNNIIYKDEFSFILKDLKKNMFSIRQNIKK